MVFFGFLCFVYLFNAIISPDPKCTKVVKCASSNYIVNDDKTCVNYHPYQMNSTTTALNYFEVDLNKCKSGFHCQIPTVNQNYICLQDGQIGNLIPQKACTTGKDCASSECNNAKCGGKSINGTCGLYQNIPNHNMCNTGLFCGLTVNSTTVYVCQQQKGLNETCASSNECKNNLICDNGRCQKYFSYESGAAVGNDFLVCKSGRAYKLDKSTYCSDYKLASQNQTHCNYTVTYANTTANVTLDRLCTLSEDKESYCPLTSDSDKWKDYINSLNTYVNSDAFVNSHVYYRSNLKEINSDLFKKSEVVNNYPQFENADKCLIDLYLSSGFIKMPIIAVLLALMSILI